MLANHDFAERGQMSEIKIGELKLKCAACGSTEFTVPDDPSDDSVIICDGCGQHLCTVAEFNAAAEERAKAAMPDIGKMVQEALFGGLKGVKSPRVK